MRAVGEEAQQDPIPLFRRCFYCCGQSYFDPPEITDALRELARNLLDAGLIPDLPSDLPHDLQYLALEEQPCDPTPHKQRPANTSNLAECQHLLVEKCSALIPGSRSARYHEWAERNVAALFSDRNLIVPDLNGRQLLAYSVDAVCLSRQLRMRVMRSLDQDAPVEFFVLPEIHHYPLALGLACNTIPGGPSDLVPGCLGCLEATVSESGANEKIWKLLVLQGGTASAPQVGGGCNTDRTRRLAKYIGWQDVLLNELCRLVASRGSTSLCFGVEMLYEDMALRDPGRLRKRVETAAACWGLSVRDRV